MREIGLTYPQYLALMVLWQDDDRSISQIAARLHLPGNAVTPLIARLERLELIVRHADRQDARVVRVRLTSHGRELERAAARVQREVVCRTGLDEVALAALRGSLHDLVEDMSTLPPTSRRTHRNPPEGAAS